MMNHNPRKRANQAQVLRLSGRGSGLQRAVDRCGGKGDRPIRSYTLKAFHIEQARAFKRDLSEQRGRSGELLSKATLYATLTALKRFFVWLAGQPSYKSRIGYSYAEYFNLSAKDARIA